MASLVVGEEEVDEGRQQRPVRVDEPEAALQEANQPEANGHVQEVQRVDGWGQPTAKVGQRPPLQRALPPYPTISNACLRPGGGGVYQPKLVFGWGGGSLHKVGPM